jgi:hypothetical protein
MKQLRTFNSEMGINLVVLGFTSLHSPTRMGMCVSLETIFKPFPCRAPTFIMNPTLQLYHELP